MTQKFVNRNHLWGVAALVFVSFLLMVIQEPIAGITYSAISIPFFWVPYLVCALFLRELTRAVLVALYFFASLTLVSQYFMIFSSGIYSDSPRYFMFKRYVDPESLPHWASTASNVAALTFAGSLFAICAVILSAIFIQSRRQLNVSSENIGSENLETREVQPMRSALKKFSFKTHMPSSMMFLILAAVIAWGNTYTRYIESIIAVCVVAVVCNMYSTLEITRNVLIIHYGPFTRTITIEKIKFVSERKSGTYRIIFTSNPVPYPFVLSRYTNGSEVAEQLSAWAQSHQIGLNKRRE